MKTYSIFFLALCGLLTLSSCSKDDESATDMITGGTWILTESRSDIDGDGDLDDDLDNCDRDDEFDFEDDGTLKFDEGATKCDASDPQTQTGTWALSPDDKTLTITVDGFGIPYEVVSLTNKRMELSGEFLGDVTEVVLTR